MQHLKSLRELIDQLKGIGEVQEIDAEVDWNLEMRAIIRRSYELRAPGGGHPELEAVRLFRPLIRP